jgi:hypothetical protein
MIDILFTFHKMLKKQREHKKLKIAHVIKDLPYLNSRKIQQMESGHDNIPLKNYKRYWAYLFDLQVEDEENKKQTNE